VHRGGLVKSVPKMLAFGLVEPTVFALILFLTAGTFDYWQAWVFLVVFALSGWIPSLYLLRTNPVALQRRIRGGPTAETRTTQKLVMAGTWSSLAAMLVVSGLDRRFGWSSMPTALCLAGAALVAVGQLVMMMVVIQNSHAAATVRVEASQKLISTGLYGLVRHPMYTGNVIMQIGFALSLGSYWALVFVLSGVAVLAVRIRDEEKLLSNELDGYPEYTQKVRYRLLPAMW
jgi:protein-S-isoprenylcysteine O-methyltransferase Ste14